MKDEIKISEIEKFIQRQHEWIGHDRAAEATLKNGKFLDGAEFVLEMLNAWLMSEKLDIKNLVISPLGLELHRAAYRSENLEPFVGDPAKSKSHTISFEPDEQSYEFEVTTEKDEETGRVIMKLTPINQSKQ